MGKKMERRQREELEQLVQFKREEVDFFASLARRAWQAVRQQYVTKDLRTATDRVPPKRIRIATIAWKQRLSRTLLKRAVEPHPDGVGAYLDTGKHEYEYLESDEKGCEAVFTAAEALVERYYQEGRQLHFLVLNELALSYGDRERVGPRWKDLARLYQLYIVPGTYHCKKTSFAIANIYSPDPQNSWHIVKQNSAERQGENIRTPDARKFYIVRTDYGNILVWICLDMYDPGLVLKFLNVCNRFENREERGRGEEVHLAFVPSFNKDSFENLDGCVRELSKFSKTAMVCVNAFGELGAAEPPRAECYGHVVGEPMRRLETAETADSCIAVFDLDLDELRAAQAAPFGKDGIHSSPFKAILTGRGGVRPVRL